MVDSRRRLLLTLAGTLGVLAADSHLFGLQLPRPAREPRPYPEGHEKGPPSPDDPGIQNKRVIDPQSQKQIREDIARIYEMASELKEEVERTNANSTLSVTLVKKAQQIEKLAKQIKELARG